MLTLAIGVAAIVAVLIIAVRLIQQRAFERSQPGRSRDAAIPIEDYGDMDIAVRMQTCRCGGRYLLRGEGPLPDAERPLRVAHMECRRCERQQRLYFDLSAVRH
jgi:hypothetical protein